MTELSKPIVPPESPSQPFMPPKLPPLPEPSSLAPAIPDVTVPETEPKERLVKLARTAMRSWVARHLKIEQEGNCPLCGLPIDLTIKGEGVVDHDHDTGRIRGVLHRSCNAAEGKIANAAARWGAKSSRYSDIVAYLESVVAYLKKPATRMIYPMHKTPDEKADARRKAAKEARANLKARRELARQNRLQKGTE